MKRNAILIDYIEVLSGLILLVFAGDFLVRGAVSQAHRFGVPTLVIGLTVVAFGTSAPELVVGVDAVLQGAPTLALGNIIGSNIANSWLVLGLPAVVAPMVCNAPRFTSNMLFMLFATGLFIIVAYTGSFTFIHGAIFFSLLVLFLYISSRHRIDDHDLEEAIEDIEGTDEPDSIMTSTGLILGGLVGLVLGAHLLVEGSVAVARSLEVSEAVIGLTIVAIGTSIPELVTALVAALRGHCEVAIGNVIGSNIFNIFGIMGIASMTGEIPVPDQIKSFDLWIMAFAALTLLPFAVMKYPIGRRAGIAFTMAYGAYILMVADSIDTHKVVENEFGTEAPTLTESPSGGS